jgi:plasmid stabilization system protein ParE
MMTRLVVTAAAREDIRRIVDYLESNAGRPIALRYAIGFDDALDRIAEMPGIGSPRPEFGRGTRIVIVNPYLVFYEPGGGEAVFVLRVLDGRRNINKEMVRARGGPS